MQSRLEPLPDGLLAALSAFLRAEGLPSTEKELVAGISEVSAAYNAAAFPLRWTPAREAARIAFFLPRDVRKMEAALRDLPIPALDRPRLRVLDLGAGVGASGLGAIRGLRGRGYRGTIALHLVEPEARALQRGLRLLGALRGLDELGPIELSGEVGDLAAGSGVFDLVVLGAVLVEVGHGQAEATRLKLLAGLVGGILGSRVEADGALVLVEPALKVCSRRLQELRGALIGTPGVFVAAPCPHDGPCPLLVRAEDWCHEDLDVDLPAALIPLARGAGLRWQGLTFSRLVLTRAPVARPPARVAMPVQSTKGKHGLPLCVAEGGPLRLVERLDRHRSPENAAFTALCRGDGLSLPGVDTAARPARVGVADRVLPWTPGD